MFKMIKYEFRKITIPIFVLLVTVIAAEVYFLISCIGFKNVEHSTISAVLLAFLTYAAYMFTLIMGIYMYSQDLKQKSGYLVFMAPISYYHIIGAKLLTTLILGIACVAFLLGFGILDYNLAQSLLGLSNITDVLDGFLHMGGMSIGQIGLIILVYLLEFLVSFFCTVTLAYFAITLSATLLQNKRGRGVVSFLIFAAILALLARLMTLVVPEANNINSLSDAMLEVLPAIGISFAAMVGAFLGTGALLSRKISL